jgi:multicomponent Na+:H+ antiporter subunit F
MWTYTTIALLICMLGPFVRCVRGDAVSRLVGLQAGATQCIFILLAVAIGGHHDIYVDLALTLALLSFGASIVFARFLERWL